MHIILMYILVSFYLLINILSAYQVSEYIQAEVRPSHCPTFPYIEMLFNRSRISCAAKCSTNDKCLKFLHCEDLGTCFLLSSSHECMSTSNVISCVCRVKKIHKVNGQDCSCYPGFYGECCENIAKDCLDAKDNGANDKKGQLVFVQPRQSPTSFEVFCLGVNIVFMNRKVVDCRSRFNTSWSSFKQGFGNFNNGYWLGLEKIHLLTTAPGKTYKLNEVIMMKNRESFCLYYYSNFSLDNEANNYTFRVGNLLSDNSNVDCTDAIKTDELTAQNRPFSTFDHSASQYDCPKRMQSSWWFADHPNCTAANLNGPIESTTSPEISWQPNYLIVQFALYEP